MCLECKHAFQDLQNVLKHLMYDLQIKPLFQTSNQNSQVIYKSSKHKHRVTFA